MTGLYGKYKIEKVNGEPLDENAKYFILRYDKDEAAREAILAYAKHCIGYNRPLATDLLTELIKIDNRYICDITEDNLRIMLSSIIFRDD